jgi:hypothetical protein
MTQEGKRGHMIRFSSIKNITNCNVLRVVLAATMAMPLGCSGGAANEDDSMTETPLELPETLRITVRNTTDRVQYIDNLYSWMSSASEQAIDYDWGMTPPPVVPALYTHQPSCPDIRSGESACGVYGATDAMVRALAPGAEYSEEWDAQAWERSFEGDPDCRCAEPVKAPAGDYLVSFGVSSSMTCSDPSFCSCEPGDSSCIGGGHLVDAVQLEQAVTWPDQGEVLIVLE